MTKAAADELVMTWPQHYLVRTSWVVGDGANFVATMQSLAARGIAPSVVDDQHGRLTHTSTLAGGAIKHLLDTEAAYGTYNVTDDGPTETWFAIARRVYAEAGVDPPAMVSPTSTEEYARGKAMAARPRHSTLSLAKLGATGFRHHG